MKTIFLIRHAKSSWDEPQLPDSERPLNNRGKKDAPRMADMLYDTKEKIEYIVSSPAKRARTTAKQFYQRFKVPKSRFILDENLYLADEEGMLDIIHALPEDYSSVALFGHNPGYTFFANLYTNYYIENVPTCGIVKLISVAETWSSFGPNNTRLAAFYYPKQFV